MSWYFLSPRGPLLVGDGRSFGGSFHRGSVFPLPQTVLGAVRAKAGEALGFDWDPDAASSELLERVQRIVGSPDAPGRDLRLRSVSLGVRRSSGEVALCLPRPADMIVFPSERARDDTPVAHPLRPVADARVAISRPIWLSGALSPLWHARAPVGKKPLSNPPAFMAMDPFASHLVRASSQPGPLLAVPSPAEDDRVHVVIDDGTLASEEGGLFSVGRLAFVRTLDDSIEIGLAVEIDGDDVNLDGAWRLGGKGSLVEAVRVEPNAAEFAGLQRLALQAIERAEGRLRWILTTPARFRRGWLPDFLSEDGTGQIRSSGIRVKLIAAAVGRALAYSGWDLAPPGQPMSRRRAGGEARPTRLLVPAGSVYFFEVIEGGADAARLAAEQAWLEPLVKTVIAADDSPAHRRAAAIDSGCGLARGVFGPWDWYKESEES